MLRNRSLFFFQAEEGIGDLTVTGVRTCALPIFVGLMNLQLAVQGDVVYVLEANPRASRTVPYVSKAIGVSLARVATKVMLGHSLRSLGLVGDRKSVV